MTRISFSRSLLLSLSLIAFAAIAAFAQTNTQIKPGRDPRQPVDEEYTRKIREYTTETFFNSPLTEYLPASKTVPTPKAVIGDIAGAPGKLPYSKDVYRYMRMLEQASPRVKVFSIGTTEEGREIRSAFLPGEPAWSLFAADYSQIELRVLAHYSSDVAMQRAFQEDVDIHTQVAAEVYNVSLDQVPAPRTGKRSRLHLDLYTTRQAEEVERLVGLGARRYAWRYPEGADYVVLEDPDGNLFCVVQVPA